jgi:hypothetical protein
LSNHKFIDDIKKARSTVESASNHNIKHVPGSIILRLLIQAVMNRYRRNCRMTGCYTDLMKAVDHIAGFPVRANSDAVFDRQRLVFNKGSFKTFAPAPMQFMNTSQS